MIKIIHCADIHLDSPFALSDPRDAELRRRELLSTFTSLTMYAKTNNAKLFLIAGDLFNDAYVSKETASVIYREMASFPDCRFFISPGNHDPYHAKSPYKMLKWPENVHIFKSGDLTKIEIPELNVDIYGYAFTSPTLQFNPFANKHPQNQSRINILLGHGDTTAADSLYCPITTKEIERSGFDYIALGHIHEGTGIIKVGESYVSYPGCLEGRGFDEIGYKGAIMGELDKGTCNLKCVKFSKKRYEIVEVDISEMTNESSVADAINASAKGYGADTAVRAVLTGTCRQEFIINIPALEAKFNNFYFIQIQNKTKPYINYNSLKTDKTIKGIFYKKLEPLLDSPDEAVRERAKSALRYGLNAFAKINIIDF